MANAQLNVKLITNGKGGHNLALDGFIYRVNRRGEDDVFWRCIKLGCSAYLSTFNNIPTGFGRPNHNHPVNLAYVINIIQRAAGGTTRPLLDHESNGT